MFLSHIYTISDLVQSKKVHISKLGIQLHSTSQILAIVNFCILPVRTLSDIFPDINKANPPTVTTFMLAISACLKWNNKCVHSIARQSSQTH